MRNRLLDRLYSALDRDPDAAVAFSLEGGMAWSIQSRCLTISAANGQPLADVALAGQTVASVVAALAGLPVVNINTSLLALSADVLIDGAGTVEPIQAHRSVLWALMSSYAAELEVATASVPQALAQATLSTAEGDWLDFWGQFFGLERIAGQEDAQYLTAILRETLRPRSNKYAIEQAVFDATSSTVFIDEPWERIFMLDGSQLSGDHRIKDSVTVGRHLIQPVAYGSVDWSQVLPVIERNRPAGVLVLPPVSRIGSISMATYPTQNWKAFTWNTQDSWGSARVMVSSAHASF